MAIKMFADGADLIQIQKLADDPRVAGFTTNPTLMRKAGVSDYRTFAHEAIRLVDPLPISFEVFADDERGMVSQATTISSWGDNVYVKIPVTNTHGESSESAIRELSHRGVKVNVTAVATVDQVRHIADALSPHTPSVVSIFAGRIADSGVDPVPVVQRSKEYLKHLPHAELLWASPREILNLVQAERAGCDIITMTPDLWEKLAILGKDLKQYSLDTVRMFHTDAHAAGYSL